ncbi:MAG: mannose-6-phosphate isomerase, class I [Chitinophagaceae bacterium]
MQRVYLLKGKLQHYDWGGFLFLADLLGLQKQNQKPLAEYWMGAHPAYPAKLETENGDIKLTDFIKENKEAAVGEEAWQQFESLPFLLKVLDVKEMLSIQVHPNKEKAVAGFEKEDERGIGIHERERNHKDRNPKPELMVALGNFYLLHGFKVEEKLIETLKTVPELCHLVSVFEEKGYQGLYHFVMKMERSEVEKVLQPLAERIVPLYEKRELLKDTPDFWAARAFSNSSTAITDPGIFSIYFLNLLHLQKGEGVYQPAGLLHAYLQGQNVEVMANSDNVLRGGLTTKHMDVNELLDNINFEATIPDVMEDLKAEEMVYKTDAAEFELIKYECVANTEKTVTAISAEIVFVYSGSVEVIDGEKRTLLNKGESAFIAGGGEYSFLCMEDSVFFRVRVPVKS